MCAAACDPMLDATGAPIGVQQNLMRHAQVSTTMEYGNALMDSKRDANSKVVRMALRPVLVQNHNEEHAKEA